MKKIINISKRIVNIGNIVILPMKSIEIDDNILNYYGNKIQALSSIGLIKLYNLPEKVNPVVQNNVENTNEVAPKKRTKTKE